MCNISAPYDRKPAEVTVRSELELTSTDRLIALIPGQHASKAWMFDRRGDSEVSAILRDYVPNGF